MEMISYQNRNKGAFEGPGKHPALTLIIMGLVQGLILTQSVYPLTMNPYYTAPQSSRDSRVGGGRDTRFDAKRAVDRFKERSRDRNLLRQRQEEKQRDQAQSQEIQQNVSEVKQTSQETAQQQQQEADFIYNRMTGLDSYSIDKNGGVYRSHLSLLVEAWNVLSRDLYGNESRSHMTQFLYNDKLNTTGFHRRTRDQAGRVTETVVSGITYADESFRNADGENKEKTRTEVTTTYHPTGNRVTQTEYFDFVYEDLGDEEGHRVIAQKARVTDLSSVGSPILQEVFNMKYDDFGNVSSSETRTTDLATGTVTESKTDNIFSEHRLVSGTTVSTTQDFINHTYTQQTFTQSVTYGGGKQLDSRVHSTTQAMDDEGNAVGDFTQTTEVTQSMEMFAGIPNPVEIVTTTRTQDHVEGQTIESVQVQKHVRDKHGNLLGVTGSEISTSSNADGSVVQTTESSLAFTVYADQALLTSREDHSFTKDLINNQEITSTSHFTIEYGDKGEVLEGTRVIQSHAANDDGTVVSDSESIEYFDSAKTVNALGLIRRETTSHTVDSTFDWNIVVTEEHRTYTQAHDEVNRVLGAEEEVTSTTTDTLGSETHVEGTVTYAVAGRANEVFAVEATNNITTTDPRNFIYTEATQTTYFEADPNTGRALGGLGVTDGTTYRMGENGEIYPEILTVHTHTEEILVGLEGRNGYGTEERHTITETIDGRTGFTTVTEETLYQEINSVGKIESAYAIARSHGQRGPGEEEQTFALTRTDFKVHNNRLIRTSSKTVEVNLNHSEYHVVVREEIFRSDDQGRLFEMDDENPENSGYQIIYHHNTITTAPDTLPTLDSIFSEFFGSLE